MTAVAERAGRPLEIVGRIKRRPPVGAVADEIRLPHLVRDVPLRRQREIIVADLREVALLPAAAVDEGDVVLGEGDERIGLGEIGNDRVGMLARIAHHVRHARFAPARVDLLVAFLARGRADIRSQQAPAQRCRSPEAPRQPSAPGSAGDGYRRRVARSAGPACPRPASPCSGCRCGCDRTPRRPTSMRRRREAAAPADIRDRRPAYARHRHRRGRPRNFPGTGRAQRRYRRHPHQAG